MVETVRDNNGNVILKKNGEPKTRKVRQNITPSAASISSSDHPAKRARETNDTDNDHAEQVELDSQNIVGSTGI